MNRYTQLSTTQFNPLSIQELSMVPMAMRQRHDAATAGMEDARAKLNAAVDALPQHSDRAKELTNTFNSMIDRQSEDLAKNGVNNMTSSNIIRMNRDYQNLMSPNGEIGRILSAKKHYADTYKNFYDEGIKMGQSAEDIARNWKNHSDKYLGYDSNGNISNIGSIGAPKKYDTADFLKEYGSLIGKIKQRTDSPGGPSVGYGPKGFYMVTNKSGSRHVTTNDPQLQQLRDAWDSKFLRADGEGYKSAIFQGKNLEALAQEANSLVGMMRDYEVNDTTNYSGSLTKMPTASELGKGAGGVGDSNMDMFTSTGSTLSKVNLPYKTGNEAVAKLETYKKAISQKGITSLTPEQRREYETLKDWRTNSTNLNNPEYNKALESLNKASSDFEKKHGFKPQDVVRQGIDLNPLNHSLPGKVDNKTKNQNSNAGGYSFKDGKKMTSSQIEAYRQYRTNNDKTRKTLDTFRNQALSTYNQPIENYQYITSADPGVNRMIESHKAGLYAGVIGNSSNISNYNIKNIKFSDSGDKMVQPDSKMKEGFARILQTLDHKKDLQGEPSFKVNQRTGKTEVTVTVKPGAISKKLPDFSHWNRIGETGKRDPKEGFTFTYELSQTANPLGIRTGLGQATNAGRQLGPQSAGFATQQTVGGMLSQFENRTGAPATFGNVSQILNSSPEYMQQAFGGINSNNYIEAQRYIQEATNQKLIQILKTNNPSAYNRAISGTMKPEELEAHKQNYWRIIENQTIE